MKCPMRKKATAEIIVKVSMPKEDVENEQVMTNTTTSTKEEFELCYGDECGMWSKIHGRCGRIVN